jgi:hypothetical protein
LLTRTGNIVWFKDETNQNPREEKLMNAPTSVAIVEKSLPVESAVEAEISNLLEQQSPKLIQIEDDAERIRSLVARITSNSIDELEGLASNLTSELQELQEFLKSEGERVQREIVNYAYLNQSALAAIKTIIETTFRAPQVATGRDESSWESDNETRQRDVTAVSGFTNKV